MKNTVFETLTLPNCLPHYGQIRTKHNLGLTYIALKCILKTENKPLFWPENPKKPVLFFTNKRFI